MTSGRQRILGGIGLRRDYYFLLRAPGGWQWLTLSRVIRLWKYSTLKTPSRRRFFFSLLTQGFRYNEFGVGWEMRFIGGTRSRRVLWSSHSALWNASRSAAYGTAASQSILAGWLVPYLRSLLDTSAAPATDSDSSASFNLQCLPVQRKHFPFE